MRIFIITLLLTLINFSAWAEVPKAQTQIKLSFAPVIKKVAPAVVNIYTKKLVRRRVQHPFFSDPAFNQFFGSRNFTRQRMENTLGSGFIISQEGLVITNAHVIEDGSSILVQLSDGRQYGAKKILVDEASDLALLKLDAEEKLPFVSFEKSENLEVGDLVLAIGNPFGIGQTVTSGIVSAVSRSASNITDFNFFIQTDAAINPGNSGGPLVSLNGKVVGVNTAIFSRSGGSLGIGFSVPSEMALSVIAAAESGQKGEKGVTRAWIGLKVQNITAEIAQNLGLKVPKGVLVSHIHPESPAAKAGLKQGDIITHLDEKEINDQQELLFRFATISLGEKIKLNTLRKGQKRIVTFKARPPIEHPKRDELALNGTHPLSGNTVINVSPAIEIEYSLKNMNEGVIIASPAPSRRFGMLSLKAGDGIITINGQKIKNTRQLNKFLNTVQKTSGWTFTIRRNGKDQRIAIRR